MSQKVTLKAAGLHTDPNQLSSIPEGALTVADNVYIDRDDVIEPRRGYNQYGQTFGAAEDRAKQFLLYKNRLLVHYDNKLLFNANPHNNTDDGNFQQFDGTYEELEIGRRIRAYESNKNLYFTTNDGIKKIAAKTANDLTTSPNFITDAGVSKALDVSGTISGVIGGFFSPNSKVAYKIVWGIKDANDNVIYGSPSSRVVLVNYSNSSAKVNLDFAIPGDITSSHFYQVFRTAVFTAEGGLTLDDIDPGNEMNLVIEDFPTSTELTNLNVSLVDETPDSIRAGGLPLYTNPNSGTGLSSANDRPPMAKDITMYQNSMFYANTTTKGKTTITLLSTDGLTTGTSSVTISDGITPRTYTFYGQKEVTTVDFSSFVGTIAGLNGKYWLLNSSSNIRKYYIWYDTTKTIQTLDFSGFIGAIPADLAGKYIVLYTKDATRKFYVWFDSTGSDVDPGTIPNSPLSGFLPIKVDITSAVTLADVANLTQAQIAIVDDATEDDFDIVYVPLATSLQLESESFDVDALPVLQNINAGFIYTIQTQVNLDPIDNTTYTNVVGRSGIRVNVSRGISTTAQLADATAAAIYEQDNASDFDVNYISGSSFTITNTNNGKTDDAVDGGFSFTGSTVTFGNPTAINETGHGLVNGDIINITASTTTPSINGTHVVTVIDANNFSIPITTTIGGTADWSFGNPVSGAFSITVNTQGDGEDASLNKVLLSVSASPAQAIDESARSLVYVINKDSSSSVYAYYISGEGDLPGQILLEAKDISTQQFSVIANDSTTGVLFNPSLPPVTNAQPVVGVVESVANRLSFAKTQQPEAVPSLNFIDIGRQDKEIHRILALRESLFILKEDGVYRLTGSNGNFSVDLFDESTQILSPDSAVVLNNQIFCFTNQGIVTISDTGISIISKQIDNIVKKIINSNYNYKFTTFGIAYETDRCYLLFLPTIQTDSVATQVLRYSTTNNGYTRYILSKTCGLVNYFDNKLYLGPSDVNFVERERKALDRTDFADREYSLSVIADTFDDTTIGLSSTQDVSVGDALVQTQFLTINEYNQLLAKLDLDPGTGLPEITKIDFGGYTGTIPADLHGKYFIIYSAKDLTRYAVFYDAQGDLFELSDIVYTELIDTTQIRVDVSTALTNEDIALATKSAILTGSFDFIATHFSGDEFLTVTTTRNGDTSDAFDSLSSSIGNGFAITVLSQGVGDYSALAAVPGDSLYDKIVGLALELDTDPGVDQTDYLTSIANITGPVAGTVSVGSPVTITSVNHGLQENRIVTILSSTSTPDISGNYIVTIVDSDNFTINATTSVGGNCTWQALVNTPEEIQAAFNTIVYKLNNDNGIFYQNYLESDGYKEFESLIVGIPDGSTYVTLQYQTYFVEGPITLFKGIQCKVQYAPEHMGDPSTMKQISQGTYIFEDTNFSRATVGYSSDLSPGFDEIDFTKSGKGDWGLFGWDQHNWGGGFSGVPLRTFIPRQKQRCLYIRTYFIHNSARESFALYGISYTFRPISERAYRK